jgi:hypothetical protein
VSLHEQDDKKASIQIESNSEIPLHAALPGVSLPTSQTQFVENVGAVD